MNHKLIPSYRLLPEPSILEKIKTLRTESADEIINSFEKIAARRRAETARTPAAIRLKETFKRAFSEGLFFYFRPWQHAHAAFKQPGNAAEAASAAINRDWAVTGDDLRAAINDYIETHDLADKLSLTDRERESLNYVARDQTPGYPRPAAPK